MKAGIYRILSANIILLIINVISGFMLPRFLSIDSYSTLKSYTFYVGYAGFLQLGFADGMYLKYGGRSADFISGEDLGINYRSYMLLNIAITIALCIVSFTTGRVMLLFFSIGAFFNNVIGYHINFYQAIGEYKLYGRALNYQKILLFISYCIMVMWIRNDNPWHYICASIITAFISVTYLTIKLKRAFCLNLLGAGSLVESFENISSGIVLMIGTFAGSVFTGIDRWFVKAFMDGKSFAFYSFSVSIESIISVFVTPVTVSLYNAFCRNSDRDYVMRAKRATLLWGLILVGLYYPMSLVILLAVPNYQPSVSLLMPLIAAQLFYSIIKGIHINLYKANNGQMEYMIEMIIMIVVAAALDACLFYIFRSMMSLSIGTFLTALIWFVRCEKKRREFRFLWHEYMLMAVLLAVFFSTGFTGHLILGMILYNTALVLCAVFFLRETLNMMLSTAGIKPWGRC